MKSSERKWKIRHRNWKKPISHQPLGESKEIDGVSYKRIELVLDIEKDAVEADAGFENNDQMEVAGEEQTDKRVSYSESYPEVLTVSNEVLKDIKEGQEGYNDIELKVMLQDIEREVASFTRKKQFLLGIVSLIFILLTLTPLVLINIGQENIKKTTTSTSFANGKNSSSKVSKKDDQVVIPDLSLLTQVSAKKRLEKEGFIVGSVIELEDDGVNKGLVIRTDPPSGSSRRQGAKITIYVSSGRRPVLMDNYVGLPYEMAEDNLLRPPYDILKNKIKIKEVFNSGYPDGVIVGQKPSAGEVLDLSKATTITFEVAATLTATMPDLSGMTYDEAILNLKSLGVPSSRIKVYVPNSNAVASGYVQIQSPAKNAKLAGFSPSYGDTIYLDAISEISLYLQDESVKKDVKSNISGSDVNNDDVVRTTDDFDNSASNQQYDAFEDE